MTKEMDYDTHIPEEAGSEYEDFEDADIEEELEDKMLKAVAGKAPEAKTDEKPQEKEKEPTSGQMFPRYQWSLMFGANREEQLVIRANTFEEFLDAKRRIDPIVAKIKSRKAEALEGTSPEGQAPICGIHGSTMVWKTGVSKKTNQPYAFWSCPTRNADGSYCKFKPNS